MLIERHNSIEAIMINNMIGRLYEFLTKNAKSLLLNDLITLNSYYYYIPILHSAEVKDFSGECVSKILSNLSTVFLNMQEHPTLHNWKQLVRKFTYSII